MANLFGKNKLREVAQKIDMESVIDFVAIVKEWHNDYHNGSLKKDKETSREQAYNQDFFIKILGYKEKPAVSFSFEPKATTDKGQLPDAVISYTDKSNDIANIAAVVELKGTGIDLDRPQRREGNFSPVQQAFKYKSQYRNCPFVIASNFWEFRLYHDNLLDYEVWTLDDLVSPDDDYILFKTWFALLKNDNFTTAKGASKTETLLSDIRIEQENIGKKFYKVYREARLELLRDIYRHNDHIKTNIDTGIEKAQKIIDRVVFAAFTEDRGLLPDNTLQRVIKAADSSTFGGSLWNTLKGFFEAIDRGSDKLEIPDGYNGGLFKYDETLNNLQISDEPLRKVVELGTYNFAEDLSVNILGHIFEQSISDLEEIKNKVNESQSLETISQSRRKKDGIFYTPDYIVRYIVDNSLGAYLREAEEKFKSEFGLKGDITDKTYEKREKQAYAKYQDFLQNIKVVDPACGSGAFLVYVFDYLLAENKRVGDILGNSIFSSDTYIRDILHKNIYGVDLNEESVEITKLSLWLKTAQKGKKLTALDDNIKCGNSLIDDPEVAGNKAFDWKKEFADIFKNGGFDVVVGNPPYVDSESMTKNVPEERNWLTKNYETAKGNWDLFVLFVQKGADLLKNGGYSSMIMPNKILSASYAKTLREYVGKNYKLVGLTDVTKEGVFEVNVYPVITNIKKDTSADTATITEGVAEIISKNSVKNTDLPENWSLLLSGNKKAVHNVETVNLGDLFNVSAAATVAEAYELKELIRENEAVTAGKIINTGTIDPYLTTWGISQINYIKNRYKYPYVDMSRIKGKDWHNVDKIIIAGMAVRIEACFSKGVEFFPAKSTTVVYSKYNDIEKLYGLLALLNSKYVSYLFHQENSQLSMAGGYMNVNKNNIAALKIPTDAFNNQILSNYAIKLIELNASLQSKSHNFKQLVSSELDIEKWSSKLNKWYMLDFTELVSALNLKLSLQQKDELLSLFEKYRTELQQLATQIQKTDHEIDQLVYKLYGLSADEVRVIEENVK
jgi:hypothetical protein